jgi:hypothetical protein
MTGTGTTVSFAVQGRRDRSCLSSIAHAKGTRSRVGLSKKARVPMRMRRCPSSQVSSRRNSTHQRGRKKCVRGRLHAALCAGTISDQKALGATVQGPVKMERVCPTRWLGGRKGSQGPAPPHHAVSAVRTDLSQGEPRCCHCWRCLYSRIGGGDPSLPHSLSALMSQRPKKETSRNRNVIGKRIRILKRLFVERYSNERPRNCRRQWWQKRHSLRSRHGRRPCGHT